MEQFSVATTSSGHAGSTMNGAAVDLIPCRGPNSLNDEINPNKVDVSIKHLLTLLLSKFNKL